MVIPEHQDRSTGYDTWTLKKLLEYNQDAVAAGVAPRWIPIAAVADANESRRIVASRLDALQR
jgi:hypothetical protein